MAFGEAEKAGIQEYINAAISNAEGKLGQFLQQGASQLTPLEQFKTTAIAEFQDTNTRVTNMVNQLNESEAKANLLIEQIQTYADQQAVNLEDMKQQIGEAISGVKEKSEAGYVSIRGEILIWSEGFKKEMNDKIDSRPQTRGVPALD